ncbi:hypothetical protein KK092_16130 [Curtobacterium flaccumfaciens pv. flaccumfaciens]|uniref:P-loop ATPase, Sll1717 family n=1 Tax=Curtobacterium flaccumfaciens TaxID=2035 RepID=UPI001BDDD98A|nr:hypothetical protein [Curtobacterium flaccumfaciens]MBT1670907.1 hypothetical protein [Curtobacterium flaccumfaciens pv. flaccumfaciens]
MSKKTPRTKLDASFTLGGEQAEADPLLHAAFLETGASSVLRSRIDERCFVVGRTGAGKSAALQRLEDTDPDHTIRISPEDLSLPYITGLDAIQFLDSLDVNLDQFWMALWKHVLLVEIIQHRYKVNSPAAKQTVLQTLRERLARDPGKQAALDYLDEFDGRFWAETDERVREITDKFATTVRGEGSAGINLAPLKLGGRTSGTKTVEHSTGYQQTERFQRIANDVQLAKLNKMMAVLDEEILDEQHFTYVVIDDLDRDWVDQRLSNDLIRCLFRVVLDLKRVTNLKVIVALRSNIFRELDFGQSGGQEEKFRSMILDVRWTSNQLEDLLDDRVKVAADTHGIQAQTLRDILPPGKNSARGSAVDYILKRTLMRPRDAIAFLNECLAAAAGGSRITWENIIQAERGYSAKRLLALRDEWKPTYPSIGEVIEKFQGAPSRLTPEQLVKILDDIAILGTSSAFGGRSWIEDLIDPIWQEGSHDWYRQYQLLTAFCFSLGFLGVAMEGSAAPRFHSDDPLMVDSPDRLRSARYFYIHRTYHSALSVRIGGAPYDSTRLVDES